MASGTVSLLASVLSNPRQVWSKSMEKTMPATTAPLAWKVMGTVMVSPDVTVRSLGMLRSGSV